MKCFQRGGKTDGEQRIHRKECHPKAVLLPAVETRPGQTRLMPGAKFEKHLSFVFSGTTK